MKMKTRYIIALAAAALMFSGCQKNELSGGNAAGENDGILKFRLSGLQLTKGALINREADMLAAGIDTFRVQAWNADCSDFLTEQTVTYSTEKSMWQTAEPIVWTGTDSKTFFAYTNLPETGATVTNTCTSDSRKQTLAYTLPLDARQQNDVMLGWYGGDGNGESTADITLIHPLSSIVLKRGEMVVDGIKSITVSGLYASGTVDVTYAAGAGGIVPTYDWGETCTGSVASYLTPTGSDTYISVDADGIIGTPFIVIPQRVAANQVKITVTVSVSGADKSLVVNVPAGAFVAGETHVFTLGGYNPYTYTFTLSDGTVSGAKSFNNTTVESTQTVTITSKKEYGGAKSDAEWLIKSVKVGSADPTPVGAGSFEGIGGLSATANTDGISITAASRSTATPGSHEYWTGSNGGWSPANWSSEGTIDLSRMDYTKDNPAQAINAHQMTTANCYIIRHAGTYKLPLVYGNAVVNGETNVQSYYPNPTAGTNRLNRFVNSKNAGITSPFIENAAGCGGSDLKCAVIWQDKDEVVKSLQIVEGASAGTAGSYTKDNVRYLQFSISQEDICQNNALICVYKDANSDRSYTSGEAIWSWHIWTTNDPALLTPGIPVTNHTNKEYDFFPLYNLGWIDPTSYPSRSDVKIVLQQKKSGNEIEIAVTQPSVATAAGNGCYYQFGRKDPMPTDNVTGFTPNVSGGSTLSNAICNPGKFYNGASYNWCKTTYDNLWTGKKSTTGTIDQDADMIKTIYDPSPVGYKMPASNAFTGFTTTGGNTSDKTQFNVSGSFDKGWYFYTKTKSTPTVFFPAAWFRSYTSGSVISVDSRGLYWSAVPHDADYGYSLHFNSSSVSPVYPVTNCSRANGFSVRPVLEK